MTYREGLAYGLSCRFLLQEWIFRLACKSLKDFERAVSGTRGRGRCGLERFECPCNCFS